MKGLLERNLLKSCLLKQFLKRKNTLSRIKPNTPRFQIQIINLSVQGSSAK